MKRVVLSVLGVLLAVGAGMYFMLSAVPPPPIRPGGGPGDRRNGADDEAALNAARDVLRQYTVPDAYRTAVQQLNAHLSRHPDEQPRALTDEERNLLQNQYQLDPAEVDEVGNRSFTPLDAAYLEEALLVGDIAHSLRVDALPALEQAKAAFAWVIREVRLRERTGDVLPPGFVVHRGWGNAHERALILLALWRQLGIDGCMTVIPQAPTGSSGSRYWIPGALVDREIYLFDTRCGLPVPAAGGKGVATLAQVRTQPDLLKALTVDPKYPYDVSPDEARKADVHVGAPLSALAPRMEYLQGVLAGGDRVNLYVNPAALLRRFQAALEKPAFSGATVRVWNFPQDPNTPYRVLRAFVPVDDGGTDTAVPPRRMQERGRLVPVQYLPPVVASVPGDFGHRLADMFRLPFLFFSTEPVMPTEPMQYWLPGLLEANQEQGGGRKLPEGLRKGLMPRDQALRGRYEKATEILVLIHGELARQRDALRADPSALPQAEAWAQQAVQLMDEIRRADPKKAKAQGPPPQLARAMKELENNSSKILLVTLAAAAEPMLPEVDFQLALCKHEQAERAQERVDRARAAGKPVEPDDARAAQQAWGEAIRWWETYLNRQGLAPDESDARLNLARARAARGDVPTAIGLLTDLRGDLTNLERTGRLYLARRLEGR